MRRRFLAALETMLVAVAPITPSALARLRQHPHCIPGIDC